jgi:hypothetical protein
MTTYAYRVWRAFAHDLRNARITGRSGSWLYVSGDEHSYGICVAPGCCCDGFMQYY